MYGFSSLFLVAALGKIGYHHPKRPPGRMGPLTENPANKTPVSGMSEKLRISFVVLLLLLHIYVRNRNCGKVMFSQVRVKNSVRGRGAVCIAGRHAWQRGDMCDRGACMAGGHVWWEGHAWQGGHVLQGGVHGRVHAWQGGVCMVGGMHGRRDDHCSGRYASYWNAFLFIIHI